MGTAQTIGQLDLLGATVGRPRRHKIVRQTSKDAYAYGRRTFVGHRAIVLRGLAAWWNAFQYSPTSGELGQWLNVRGELPGERGNAILIVRRRLNDLFRLGIVDTVKLGDSATPASRICAACGSKCETWRVREIGSAQS